MSRFDAIYFIAFAVFLAGAGASQRTLHRRRALWVMVAGVLLDFFATIMPAPGFKSLAINIGSNRYIMAGIMLGVVVWCLFLVAVFVRLMNQPVRYARMLSAIKIIWFVDLALLLQGVYGV